MEVPLARLVDAAEARVPKRVAEERGVSLGPAGSLDYAVDRGAFTARIERERLILETPVSGHAEACRRGRCYAECDPRAVARAELPLVLKRDFGFAPSSVRVEFTRGCRVRVLGGFLTVDVTPTLEAELAKRLARVARDLDRQLPDLPSIVAEQYRKLAEPRQVPLLGCVLPQLRRVIQGPVVERRGALLARFAVEARPELRTACDSAPAPGASVPELTRDEQLAEVEELRFDSLHPLSGVDRSLVAAPSFAIASRRADVVEARSEAWGEGAWTTARIEGELCGTLEWASKPRVLEDGAVVLSPTFSSNDASRLRERGIDVTELTRALESASRLEPLLSAEALRTALPALLASESPAGIDVSADVASARTEAASIRDSDLRIQSMLRGRLRVSIE